VLNFSPKIRLGNLINVMVIKKHAFILSWHRCMKPFHFQ